MGARSYDPSSERYLQQDQYDNATDDLGLSTDPITANRYALTGSNPVNFDELDGHNWVETGEDGGSTGNTMPAQRGRIGDDGDGGGGPEDTSTPKGNGKGAESGDDGKGNLDDDEYRPYDERRKKGQFKLKITNAIRSKAQQDVKQHFADPRQIKSIIKRGIVTIAKGGERPYVEYDVNSKTRHL